MTPRFATATLFFVNGFVFANWLARIPTVASNLQLSSSQVGAALLGMGVGALTAFPLTGSLIERFGSRRITVAFGALFTLSLPLLAFAPQLPWLVGALWLFGFGNGGMDVAMNAQGVEVERSLGRSIMNSLHGFFSLGGLWAPLPAAPSRRREWAWWATSFQLQPSPPRWPYWWRGAS